LVALLATIAYVYRFSYNIPWQDDWIVIDILTGDRPMTLDWLWAEHNEHRLPLSKFLLIVSYKMTGDFRPAMYFNVAAMGALALAMIRAARDLRGRTSPTDAFFPIMLLHWGHSEVFLWSFEICYTLSVLLAGIALLVIVYSRESLTVGGAIVLGTCLILLPLTGANGLVHAPPLTLWLLYAGVVAGYSRGPGAKRRAAVILSFAFASMIVTAAYLIGREKRSNIEHMLNYKALLVTSLQYLTGAFGPAAAMVWPYSGRATAGLFLLGGAILVVRAYRGTSPGRLHALGLLLFLGSMACMTLALGWGRAFVAFFPPFMIMRYYILTALAPCCLYFAWTACKGYSIGSFMQMLLFGSIVLMLPFNMQAGLDWARIHGRTMEECYREIKAGSTPAVVAEHYRFFLYPWEPDEWMAKRLQRMKDVRIGPFSLLHDDPVAVREVPLSVEPAEVSPMTCTEEAGRFFLLDEDPYVEFALEKPEFVYALKLECSYGDLANVPVSFGMSWKKAGGRASAGDGSVRLEFGHPHQARESAREELKNKTITVLVNDTIDHFRIRPDIKPCFFKLSKMSFLVPEAEIKSTRFRSFDAKGVKIHFLVEGKGEPVVLIHGLHSSAEINWRMTGVVAELAKDHQVIAFDIPGHGQSDRPENEDAYGLQVVEDVVLLLDHLKIDRAHLVGYSVGGMVALKFLARHPGRSLSGTIGGMGWLREGSPIQAFWDRMPAPEGRPTPPAFIRSVAKLAMTAEELKKIRVPVEILIGDRDPVKRMYVVPLQHVRNDWPVVDIKDAGHINCIIKKQFRQEIGAWVRKQKKM